jgi:hypothetical protein
MGSPKTSDGKPIFSVFPTKGTRATIVTHNWCDKTTWYQGSVRVVDEVADPIVAGTSYQLDHTFVIDTFHGKLWAEDGLEDADGHSYRVTVKVNSVEADEVDPHTAAGDYSINYAAGTITFSPAIAPGDTVEVTYHYATSSVFVVSPLPGKVLKIRTVEVQFARNVGMLDTVDFVAYGLVDVFAPELMPGVPSGTKIPISTTRYKTMYDFQAESNGAMPEIPAIGGASWRGIQNPIIVFPWTYAALLSLDSALGMEVRISLLHDTVFTGEFATATMYCLSEPA